jgi:hypothetical protein
MDDLIIWLRTQYDADERIATSAAGAYPHWVASSGAVCQQDTGGSGYLATGPYETDLDEDVIEHMVLHDPARVLADIAAKRAILDEYERASAAVPEDEQLWNTSENGYRAGLATAIEHLATAYADRPGWREEWRP